MQRHDCEDDLHVQSMYCYDSVTDKHVQAMQCHDGVTDLHVQSMQCHDSVADYMSVEAAFQLFISTFQPTYLHLQ